MKDDNKSNRSGAKRKTIFRFSAENLLLGFFACLSLAFALFYTFEQNTTFAGSNDAKKTASKASGEVIAPANRTASPATVSNVVTKALAFKASLTTAQQATLEKTYTASLARKWSNLPCGSGCRNGIQFSTLTATQLQLALDVIQAAAGTTANEGSDEFNQIRAADGYLGANGGGSGYSSGIYFISFLNTPTTTGAWMLQYGGHHYAANIAYNGGHVVGATPLFYGVEPTSFTVNGTTYTPLSQEHDALANMLASLTTAQLATAKLSTTYSDVTMSPGETNGGNGTFPTTKVGIQVSALSDGQKLLVLEAMKPWVKDMDDTVASRLLSIYESELSGTYIAYTGNGTSGNPSSFLNANTNYARIDGPGVWIEFICQNGVVFSGIHYHTIWRDHTRDYGADLSLTVPLDTKSTTANDFDGDSKTDISVFRPSTGVWWINRSASSATFAAQFGVSTDKIVPGDYTGDGLTDIAVFRPVSGEWFILRSENYSYYSYAFGANGDLPAVGDFDGDGKSDTAVFRPSDTNWYIRRSSDGGATIQQFGASGDVPAVEDYDNDGKSDIAIWRASAGQWWIQKSSNSSVVTFQFGTSTDKPVQGDYTGDGLADVAIWRPSTGEWFILRSEDFSYYSFPFGANGDTPAPGDYDGDGKFDAAVFRSTDTNWYIQRSTAGTLIRNFGVSGDTPVPSAFIP
ncbi:MAG: DUF3500 domain-containing protein [Pyrinomonadaceae bacterium]